MSNLNTELYDYIKIAILHNLDYDRDSLVILSNDQNCKYKIYFELENNLFIGHCYLVNINKFCKIAKSLSEQGLDFNLENTKDLTRHKLEFKIDANKIMTSLYNMTGL